MKNHWIVSLLVACLSSNLHADVIELVSAADGDGSYIGDFFVGSGTSTIMRTGRQLEPLPGVNTGLLVRFDVDSLPAAATINSARLQLFQTSGTTSDPTRVRYATSAWTEATLNNSATRLNSLIAGGTQLLVLPSSTVGQYVDFSSTEITQKVRDWHTAPQSNFGFYIEATTFSGTTIRSFATREGLPEQAPRLVVDFMAVPEPTPALISILVLCAFGCIRKR